MRVQTYVFRHLIVFHEIAIFIMRLIDSILLELFNNQIISGIHIC